MKIGLVVVATAGAVFFLAPVLSMPIATIDCVPSTVYSSLSYKIFGSYGMVYWPASGWVDFPPLYFHVVVC